MSESLPESHSRRVSRPCPWCGEAYDEFRWHDDVVTGDAELPADGCESPLGFWVHEDGDGDG